MYNHIQIGGFFYVLHKRGKKLELITNKPANMDVRNYCKEKNISYSSFYKWSKELGLSSKGARFIDVTNLVKMNASKAVYLEINGISINAENDNDENLIISLVRTLKKI